VAEARETFYEQTPTRVLRAEHLAAMAVQTGREKDRECVRLLREQAPWTPSILQACWPATGWRPDGDSGRLEA